MSAGYDRRVIDTLRLALVGVGRMGAFHARALLPSPLVDIVAIADTNASAAAELAAVCSATAHADVSTLGDRDDIDAWLISTPTTTHPEMVRAALAAGAHVLCEKPLALDPSESDALGAEAAHLGLVLQVGFWRRFAPPWAKARELVEAGVIGRPLMVRLSQWDANPPPATFCDPVSSGGLAIDCGVHEYDLAQWLTGLDIVGVAARNLPLVDETLAEVGDVDNLVAVLDLEGGAVATVDLSRNCRYADDVRTEILGSDGAVFVDLLPVGRTRLATATRNEVVAGSETDDAFAAGVRAQAELFARVVRGDPLDYPGAQASSRAVAAGLEVRRVAAERSVPPASAF